MTDTPPSAADVYSAAMEVISYASSNEDQKAAWATGTATGGFHADGTPSAGANDDAAGYYPFNLPGNGGVLYVPCPAKIASTQYPVGTSYTANTDLSAVSAVASAVSGAIVADDGVAGFALAFFNPALEEVVGGLDLLGRFVAYGGVLAGLPPLADDGPKYVPLAVSADGKLLLSLDATSGALGFLSGPGATLQSLSSALTLSPDTVPDDGPRGAPILTDLNGQWLLWINAQGQVQAGGLTLSQIDDGPRGAAIVTDEAGEWLLWVNAAGQIEMAPGPLMSAAIAGIGAVTIRGGYTASEAYGTTTHVRFTSIDRAGRYPEVTQRRAGAQSTAVVRSRQPLEIVPYYGQSQAGPSSTAIVETRALFPFTAFALTGEGGLVGNVMEGGAAFSPTVTTDLVPLQDPSSGSGALDANYPNSALIWSLSQLNADFLVDDPGYVSCTSYDPGQPLNDFLPNAQCVGSINGTTLTLTTVTAPGVVEVGDLVIGAAAGTVINSLGTSTGGTGTAVVSVSQTLASAPLVIGRYNFENLIAMISAIKTQAANYDRNVVVRCIVINQGEAGPDVQATWATYFGEIVSALTASVMAKTGQQLSPKFLVVQTTNNDNNSNPPTHYFQNLAIAGRSDSVIIGPTYCYPTDTTDRLHLTALGKLMQGDATADVYRRMRDTGTFQCVEPDPANPPTRAGTVITVPMVGPGSPLSFDTTWVPAVANYGFSYTDGSGSPPAISSVAISGMNVVITLASTPTGAGKTIGYAATPNNSNANWTYQLGQLMADTGLASPAYRNGQAVPATIRHYACAFTLPVS